MELENMVAEFAESFICLGLAGGMTYLGYFKLVRGYFLKRVSDIGKRDDEI